MKITVTGRHMELTEVLKKYATGKIEHLRHYFDNVFSGEVVFSPENGARYSAEIILHAPRHSVLVVHAQDKSATAAFDLAVEKVERQLIRLKDKLRGKTKPTKRPRGGTEVEAVLGDAASESWW